MVLLCKLVYFFIKFLIERKERSTSSNCFEKWEYGRCEHEEIESNSKGYSKDPSNFAKYIRKEVLSYFGLRGMVLMLYRNVE